MYLMLRRLCYFGTVLATIPSVDRIEQGIGGNAIKILWATALQEPEQTQTFEEIAPLYNILEYHGMPTIVFRYENSSNFNKLWQNLMLQRNVVATIGTIDSLLLFGKIEFDANFSIIVFFTIILSVYKETSNSYRNICYCLLIDGDGGSIDCRRKNGTQEITTRSVSDGVEEF